jgi:hypothetical protein
MKTNILKNMMYVYPLILVLMFSPIQTEGAYIPETESFKLNARLMRKWLSSAKKFVERHGETNLIFSSTNRYRGALRVALGKNSIKSAIMRKRLLNGIKKSIKYFYREIRWRFGGVRHLKNYLVSSHKAWHRQIIIILIIVLFLRTIGLGTNGLQFIGLIGATYYIDFTLGDDGNAGTAPGAGNAWKTLTKVSAQSPSPGDEFLFKRGETWSVTSVATSLYWITKGGNSGSDVLISNYDAGALPKFDGGGTFAGHIVRLNNCDYVDVDGIHVTDNGSSAMFYIYSNSTYITVQNSTIDYANGGGVGLYMVDTSYMDVLYCKVNYNSNGNIGFGGSSNAATRCNNGRVIGCNAWEPDSNDCIVIHTGGGDPKNMPCGSTFDISYNDCRRAPENCLDFQSGTDINAHHNSLMRGWVVIVDIGETVSTQPVTGLKVYQNYVYHNPDYGSGTAIFTRTEGAKYYNNIIVIDHHAGTSSRCVLITDESLITQIGNTEFCNNTVLYKSDVSNYEPIEIFTSTSMLQDSLTIKNNIIVGCRDNVIDIPSFITSVGSDIDYNQYWTTGITTTLVYNGVGYTSIVAWTAATGFDAHGAIGNPLFDDLTGATLGYPDDLKLQVGSPCVGTATPIGYITVDYADVIRDLTTPDMGGYELGGTPPSVLEFEDVAFDDVSINLT